jgi:hypothetical protein
MKLACVVRRTLFFVAAVALPAAAQQQISIHDPLLNMNADYIACPQGFHCEGAMVRNPLSLDPQVVYTVIRADGRAGYIQPANFWTLWPNSHTAQMSGAVATPFAPATELLKRYIVPQRVLPMFPGARVVSIEQETGCQQMREGQTNCGIAVLNYTTREGAAMDAVVEARCLYEQIGGNSQFNNVLFIVSFAPRGQIKTAAPRLPQMRVDPNWHAREQQRAQQFSAQYQRMVQGGMNQITATGADQVAAIHHYGDVVRYEGQLSQHAIDVGAHDMGDYVGDKVTVHSWRNTHSGEITHTDSGYAPGPDWVEIQGR